MSVKIRNQHVGIITESTIIIREAIMIEHELGNWKDFIEGMLRK